MPKKRKIAVICSSRATYGYKRRIISLIRQSPDLEPQLIVTGAHLMEKYGYSVRDIEADGHPIMARLAMSFQNDTPSGWVAALGGQMADFADVYKKLKPDIVLVTGDRAEMFIAGIAAAYMNIPVAHIQSGDVSGHIDGSVRHAITKLAHIHFPACRDSADRVRRLGEEDWRIATVGAPQLDDLVQSEKMTKEDLQKEFGFDFNRPVILIVFHPVLVEHQEAAAQMHNIMETVKELGEQTIVIFPNADPGNFKVIREANRYKKFPFIKIYRNLSREMFIGLMAHSAVLVGNSSAGILEAPSLKLAAVNIGSRQRGRLQADNVVNVGHNKKEIMRGIKLALTDGDFKKKLSKCVNPYGDGHSAERIVKILRDIKLDKKLLDKIITY